jgi:uncharacterized repeat protein (TIGR01451 family)
MSNRFQRLLFIVLVFAGIEARSSVNTTPFTAALDTFNVINGDTLDAPNADDVLYPHLPIGFSFNFGGNAFDTMAVSCNGYVLMGTTSGTFSFFNNPLSNASNNNVIAAFGADLMHRQANASLQYTTTGTAPNRICTIQWMHYSYFGGMNGDVSFQIQLHETSNCINFVYGPNFYSTNPLNTQIGMRGDTLSDFIALGDTSCNWASAYPFPSVNTAFPVSTSCSMPSGFAYHFGSCTGNGSLAFGSITGSMFNDVNGNGVKDTGEPPLRGHILSIQPGNTYVASDASGRYALFFVDSSLTYTLTAGGITYWAATTGNPATVTPLSQSCSNVDFGFQAIPNIHEVSIHCPSWNAKPGQPEPMPIWYSNNGTTIESDTITFTMDSLYTFISSTPAPLSVNGSVITWVYPPLAPRSSGHIQLMLLPDSTALLGDSLYSSLSIGPRNDTIPANNILALHQLLSNAWDPNEKLVTPSGKIAAGTELTYTIHFQNTGNAAAANVVVKDTLDSHLDLLSFNMLGYSHPVNFSMNGQGIATFTFYNIQLPDSGSDQAGSNGYISFRIKAKNQLAPQTVINNTAGIYFDSNPVVMTNTASDTIALESPLYSGSNAIGVVTIRAVPNPSNGRVVFHFSENTLESASLMIHSIGGQLVYQQDVLYSTDAVDLSFLSAGVYHATLRQGDLVKQVKIVRE